MEYTKQEVLLSDSNILQDGIYKLKVNYCYVGDSFSIINGKVPAHVVNKVTYVKKKWGKRQPVSFVFIGGLDA